MKQCEAPSRERENKRDAGPAWPRCERDGREEWKKPRNCGRVLRLAGIIACAHRRKQLRRKSAFSTGVALIALHRRSEGASFRRHPHPWELQESRDNTVSVAEVHATLIPRCFARPARNVEM